MSEPLSDLELVLHRKLQPHHLSPQLAQLVRGVQSVTVEPPADQDTLVRFLNAAEPHTLHASCCAGESSEGLSAVLSRCTSVRKLVCKGCFVLCSHPPPPGMESLHLLLGRSGFQGAIQSQLVQRMLRALQHASRAFHLELSLGSVSSVSLGRILRLPPQLHSLNLTLDIWRPELEIELDVFRGFTGAVELTLKLGGYQGFELKARQQLWQALQSLPLLERLTVHGLSRFGSHEKLPCCKVLHLELTGDKSVVEWYQLDAALCGIVSVSAQTVLEVLWAPERLPELEYGQACALVLRLPPGGCVGLPLDRFQPGPGGCLVWQDGSLSERQLQAVC